MIPDDLLGTPFPPANYAAVRTLSRKSRAYYALCPYPNFSAMTKNWKTEERGPFPRCRPFPRTLINKGATWLFGKQVTFRCSEEDEKTKKHEKLNELINKTWTSNDMTRRSRMSAVTGANSGGVAARFSYDDSRSEIVQIDILDPTEQVRFYWNPDNIQELWMARVQYPYYDASNGQVFWKREDYTDNYHVVYKPMAMATIVPGVNVVDPYEWIDKVDAFDKWERDEKLSGPNQFGIIPLWYIRNEENGTQYGEGDLWTMFEIIDQINFTYNLGHKDNQKSIDPTTIYIDLAAPDGDQPGTSSDSKLEILQSANDNEGKQGKVEQLQTNASLRPYLDQFASDLKHELLMGVGSVDFKPEEITNKGNLTAAVMLQMYAPLVERTGEKRQCYGEDGYCVFFERMSKGMSNLGVEGWEEDVDVQIVWHPYFEETEDEKTLLANRQISLVEANLTTHEMAVREIASSDGVPDIDKLLAQVEKEKKEAESKEQREMNQMQSAMDRQRKGLGG